jgi:hypothetical protein
MTRSFIVYQGEDGVPEFDLTESDSPVHVIWEEVEAGGRAYKGESTLSSIPMRDERGETGSSASLPSNLTYTGLPRGSRIEWLEGSNRMFRGRIGTKDYRRGRQKADRAREVTVSAADTNEDLRGIIVDGWSRPAETDVARVQALITDYLTGSPRTTTVITNGYLAAGSNTVSLAAKVYDATNPAEVLSEVAVIANKLHFVTIDDELFYDGWDSTAYLAGLRISDRLEESTVGQSSEPASTVRLYPSLVDAGSASNAESLAAPNLGAADKDAAWDTPNNGGIVDYDMLYDSPLSTTTTSRNSWDGVNQAAGDFCIFGFEHRLDGDLLSIVQNGGTVRGQMNSRARFVSTLVAVGDSVGTVKFRAASAGRNASFGPITFTAFAGALDGDYLVIDVGNRHVGPLSGGAGAGSAITDSQASDLPLDDISLDALNSWWQLGPAEAALPTYPPIWDVGPASTEDGMQLLSGLRLYYGQGSNTYVYVDDPVTANQYWHNEESLYTNDPLIDTAAKATTLARSILQRRKYEERTYNVSIGPLDETEVGLIKPGQLINIKARAIPDADDLYVSRRIAQLRWTTPVSGMFFAHMQLDRPIKEVGYGVGPKSATDSINRHLEQGSNSHPELVQRGVLTTQGDLPYRGASDWTRLAIGASNTWLKSTGSTPVWADLPSLPATVTVKEVDGAPSVAADTIIFPNGTLTDNGSGDITYTPGAGGSGTAWLDPVPSGNAPAGTDDDEFADASLTGFTAQTVSGTATWTEDNDVLSVLFHSQTSGDWAAQLKALTTPSSPLVIQTAVRVFSPHTSSALVGLLLTDGTTTTSNCIAATTIVTTSNNNIIAARGWTLTDLQNPVLDQHASSFSMMIPWLYMRLTWSAANTFLAEWSPDGVTWSDFGLGNQSHTMTPTHMGVAVTNFGGGTTTPRIATFEYLRRS